jgi:hypothetical protein
MKHAWITGCALLLLASCQQRANTKAVAPAGSGEAIPAAHIPARDNGEMLKSAIIETETEMPQGMGKTSMKVIFDHNGKDKLTEFTTAITVSGQKINNTSKSLLKGNYLYTWSDASAQGTKIKLDPSFFDPKQNLDFSNLTDELKAKYHFSEVGNGTVGGRICKVYSYSTDKFKGKVWLWKQVPLKSEVNVNGKIVTTNFKSMQENPEIPASTFDVPKDITFRETEMPSGASK